MLNFWWIPVVPQAFGWFFAAALVTSWMAYREKLDRTELMQLFSRHVSDTVAEEIWRRRDNFLDGGRPRPQELTVTVLFSDIANFTPISEGLEPVELMEWLNEYLARMAQIVIAHNAVVDKFIGDAVMAVFGVPLPRTDDGGVQRDAISGVRCALAMAEELDRLNEKWRAEGAPNIGMRIGLHTGLVVAGSLGSQRRMDYTVIGDTVNTASRLESYGRNLSDVSHPVPWTQVCLMRRA